jgi:choline dehydrogenase-like flavoprotein
MILEDTNQWYTPREVLDPVKFFFNLVNPARGWFDPCGSPVSIASLYADEMLTGSGPLDDCLLRNNWPEMMHVFNNPPYSDAAPFVDAHIRQFQDERGRLRGFHRSAGIMLVNSATSTKWWQKLARTSRGFCFVTPRIRFLRVRKTDEEIIQLNSNKPEQKIQKLIEREQAMETVEHIGGRDLVQPASPRYESTIFWHGAGSFVNFARAFEDLGVICQRSIS